MTASARKLLAGKREQPKTLSLPPDRVGARHASPLRPEQVAELLLRDAAFFRRGHVDLRELVAPMPWPAGVDDRAAVGMVADRLALGLEARIERRRPAVADDVDRGRRVPAREHGPDQSVHIGDV